MSPLDWVVLVSYVSAIVAFGVWAGRGSRKVDDFFLAGRRMRWWAVGLSVMATQISAITFVGTTGQAYTDGMRFLAFYFGLPFAMVILCATLVPFFYRARVYTAYEYLERRFDGRVRTLTSVLFLLSRGLSVGITLYAPSLVLSVILGWSEPRTILTMGLATIAYVAYGGNRSVIWTDVVQMAVVWFGIFLCFGVAVSQIPVEHGIRDALALAQAAGRLNIVDVSPSLTKPYTLWGGLVAGVFLMMGYFGCDQSQVQRYLASSSLTQSRLSLLFNAFLKVPMQFVILLTGVLVFVFYHFHETPLLWNPSALARLEREADPAALAALRSRFETAHAARRVAASSYMRTRDAGAKAAYLDAGRELDEARNDARELYRRTTGSAINDTNYIFPSYVLAQLPRGLAGLVIAVIFAAAMSALAGELNSLATASMVDFYKRFVRPGASDAHDMLASRAFTAVWGGFACLVAMRAGQLGSAIEAVNRIGSYFYGLILGVFGLAVLTKTATSRGAIAGVVAGGVAIALVARFTPVHFLWYNAIGAVCVFGVGLLVSAARPVQGSTPE